MKTNTLPPKDIYDVIHKAKAKGVAIPKSVEKWFELETAINESPYCQKCTTRDCNINCKTYNEADRHYFI